MLEALQIGNCATVKRLDEHLQHRVPEINLKYGKFRQSPYTIVEPASKYNLILLPEYATPSDIQTLKGDAYKAEAKGDYELARQLWIRVNVAAAGSDLDVIAALPRIIQRQGQLTGPSQSEPSTTPPRKKLLFKFDVVTVNAQGRETNRSQRQAQYFTENLDNGVTLEMVAIPGGTFLMGSPETEEGRDASESPQHKVTVEPFFMGKYPITQAQWRAIASLSQVNRSLESDPSYFKYFKGDNRPVEGVSWYEAVEFCARLSRFTQREYCLPSEAEWEYACRAETITPFHFGETMTPDLANYNGEYTYGATSKGENRRQTTPVGSFQVANAFGLYDMHGNVWEWCADHWHTNYQGAPTDGSAWLDKNDKKFRVLRGGSWVSYPDVCRSAFRYNYGPGVMRNCDIGFRIVCAVARSL